MGLIPNFFMAPSPRVDGSTAWATDARTVESVASSCFRDGFARDSLLEVRIHLPPAESPQTFGSCSRRANSFHPRIPDAASGSRPDKVLKPFLSGAELRVRIHS